MPFTEYNADAIPVEKYRNRLLSYRKIEGECWIWTGYTRKSGHGEIMVREVNDNIPVHRLALYLFSPDKFRFDLFVLHICSCPNKACFNPQHLYAGTPAENMEDKAALITHCPHGHQYNKENTGITKRTFKRYCRICKKERSQAWRRRS